MVCSQSTRGLLADGLQECWVDVEEEEEELEEEEEEK